MVLHIHNSTLVTNMPVPDPEFPKVILSTLVSHKLSFMEQLSYCVALAICVATLLNKFQSPHINEIILYLFLSF